MGNVIKSQHEGEDRTSGQEASLHPVLASHRRSIDWMIYFDGEQNGEKLQEALCSYTTETLDCIHTVRGLPGWIHERKGELNKIKAIKNRADKLQENLNPFELMDRTRRQAVLREELALVLEDTLKGLEKLSCFVDAVKKLAVTSPRVFMQEKHVVIHLPAGVSLELVQEVIQAARLICPILFTYEQEADDSFLPELQNLEVISQQLDENIQTVQRIYDILEIRHLSQRMSTETAVALAEDLSEDDIRRMLSDIKQLDEIRKDQHFWTVFLFQEGTESEFIREFEERQPKMLQSLRELKQVAVLLDSMNLWARISDVVGSSVVTVGVLLIIAGLGLIPFTDGGSLALTVMGLVIIGTNRVNAAFTRATEIGVNTTQQQKAKESLENFKEDLQSIQACLDEVLCSYTTETLDCIHTVRGLPGWIHERKGELNKIKDIKNRADKLQENLNPFELMDRTRRQAVLREEQELALVLEDTLKGLEKLGCFLDAVKKLAVTSPRVFMQEKHVVIHLPAGVSLELVQEVIQAARLICPILFTYEQEADDSFLPKLQNLEVISQQLDEYIQTVQRIYDILEIRHLSQRMSTETAVALAEDLSEDDIRRMLSHIKQLNEIRKDQHFREFEERQPKMLQSLKKLKQVAVQLDSMNLWARISGVVGSSVVTVGVLLIIAGLGLIPFTDGGSLALTVMGLVIIGTNRVNAAFTRATEIGVNTTQQQKAKEILENFKEDLQSIQACLDEVITQQVIKLEARPIDMAAGVQRVLLETGAIGTTGMGKVTAKGAVALSKSARGGLVGLNALFVGLEDSTSLAKGSETDCSKSIRAIAARAAAAVDLWQKIYNSLKSEESRDLLEEPFYPQK